MNDKINDRTPEEIYKALRCVITQINDDCEDTCDSCKNCPNDFDGGRRELAVHLADTIVRIQQLERERDAAVEQLGKGGSACSTCKFSEDIPENDKICEECRLTGTKLLYSNWEWVGPQEVE